MNVTNIYIIVALLLSFICTDAVGQSDDRYMVFLRDKGGVSADDVSPASYLSPRALQRRAAQGIDIDSLDVPVYAEYVEEISAYARIIGKTKWMNAVMVATAQGDDAIESIERLPFVTGIQLVGHYMPETPADVEADMSVTYPETDDYHGVMRQPLECNAIDHLHDDGFTGEGMLIAMTDDGYCNVDSMLGGWADNIVCVRDFVNAADSLLYDIGSHGVRTFSCIAADMPHKMVGSAPGASYALLRTEYLGGEQPAEEYYWAFAAEFADSIGADICRGQGHILICRAKCGRTCQTRYHGSRLVQCCDTFRHYITGLRYVILGSGHCRWRGVPLGGIARKDGIRDCRYRETVVHTIF